MFITVLTRVKYVPILIIAHKKKTLQNFVFFVFGATVPPVGQGLPIHEVSRSHTTTHHSQ